MTCHGGLSTTFLQVLFVSLCLVVLIGIVLGCVAFTITYCELHLRTNLRDAQVAIAFNHDNTDDAPNSHEVMDTTRAHAHARTR